MQNILYMSMDLGIILQESFMNQRNINIQYVNIKLVLINNIFS